MVANSLKKGRLKSLFFSPKFCKKFAFPAQPTTEDGSLATGAAATYALGSRVVYRCPAGQAFAAVPPEHPGTREEIALECAGWGLVGGGQAHPDLPDCQCEWQ